MLCGSYYFRVRLSIGEPFFVLCFGNESQKLSEAEITIVWVLGGFNNRFFLVITEQLGMLIHSYLLSIFYIGSLHLDVKQTGLRVDDVYFDLVTFERQAAVGDKVAHKLPKLYK
jgi:hypothetical protein